MTHNPYMDNILHFRTSLSLQYRAVRLLDICKDRTNLHVVSSLIFQNTSLLLSEQELVEFCSQQILSDWIYHQKSHLLCLLKHSMCQPQVFVPVCRKTPSFSKEKKLWIV